MLAVQENQRRDTLRRKVHIPLQVCASPLWLTTLGKAHLGTGHHKALQVRQKMCLCSIQCIMSSEVYSGQQKINPASYACIPALQTLSIPLADKICVVRSTENELFYGQ